METISHAGEVWARKIGETEWKRVKDHTCNNLSLRLVQNIGQVTSSLQGSPANLLNFGEVHLSSIRVLHIT